MAAQSLSQQPEEQEQSYPIITTDIIAMITRGCQKRHMRHGNVRLVVRDGKFHSVFYEDGEIIPHEKKLTRRNNITVLGDRS